MHNYTTVKWLTQCIHFTAGCITAYFIQLGELCKWAQPSGAWAVQSGRFWRYSVDAQQGGYVDSRRCGAFDRIFKKNSYLFIYLLPSVAYDPEGWQNFNWPKTIKLYSTLFICLFIYLLYEYSKRFVQPGRLYNRLYSWLYNRLQSVNGLWWLEVGTTCTV